MIRVSLLHSPVQLFSAVYLVILTACARPNQAAVTCTVAEAEERWQLDMRADSSDIEVRGSVFLSSRGGRTDLVAISADGGREPLNYPLETKRTPADSIALKFAPIGFSLVGRCTGTQKYSGRFSVPQPPFRDITGSFTLTKADSAP